jgi:hypothetical protein
MLDFCTTNLVYLENLITVYQSNRVKNCLKYKTVKASCPFKGHLRPFLEMNQSSCGLIRPLLGCKASPLFVRSFPPKRFGVLVV